MYLLKEKFLDEAQEIIETNHFREGDNYSTDDIMIDLECLLRTHNESEDDGVAEDGVFKRIELEAHKIRGEWNGDDSGHQEEQANIAEEVQGKVKELKELLIELRN